jgi:hypothetical protein
MNIRDIANRLIGLCRQGETGLAKTELYSDNIVSTEGGVTVHGIQAVLKKSEEWQSKIETFHGISVSDAILAADHFAINMVIDVTYRGGYRNIMNEIGVYEVKNGKIINEQFFYSA